MLPLILASTSTYRRELMTRLHTPFEAIAPPYDETDDPTISPQALLERHAAGKAQSLRKRFPAALIIGSDQGLIADGELLGKPGTVARACEQLRGLSGGTHQLVTALALLNTESGVLLESTEVHHLTFRDLSDQEIANYIERDQPLDCAGSFKIESLGIALFKRIEGEDPTSIMGLPMMRLVTLLGEMGMFPLRG